MYLTNPQEILPEHILAEQLCSDGVLKIRRKDVVGRWKDGCSLAQLLHQKDPRWATYNVIGNKHSNYSIAIQLLSAVDVFTSPDHVFFLVYQPVGVCVVMFF